MNMIVTVPKSEVATFKQEMATAPYTSLGVSEEAEYFQLPPSPGVYDKLNLLADSGVVKNYEESS